MAKPLRLWYSGQSEALDTRAMMTSFPAILRILAETRFAPCRACSRPGGVLIEALERMGAGNTTCRAWRMHAANGARCDRAKGVADV